MNYNIDTDENLHKDNLTEGIDMARISKSTLTRLEIIQVASKLFLQHGYSNTTARMISEELKMSPGNLTFHFPSKEHLLLELVELLCEFQRDMMEKEADEGFSSVMAVCLELTAMATMCEGSEIAKDFYLSAYSSQLCLEAIRKNDAKRARQVFGKYRPAWTEEQYAEAEILVSGIEYATLMTTDDGVSLETRIAGALNNILGIYGVPEETRRLKLEKVFSLNYRAIGARVLTEFKAYVEEANEQAFYNLIAKRKE